MDYDSLLESFDSDVGQKQQIALIVYFYEEVQNEASVTQSDVKDVVRQSRSSIKPSSVYKYFSRLEDSDWITSAEDGGYQLTLDGRNSVTELLDEDALNSPRDNSDLFLEMQDIDEDHYSQLVEDINDCYQYRIYDATMVLTRKFFEDLVFQILKTHYAGIDNQMFYDQENNRHYSFQDLISNLRDCVPTLRQYSRELDEKMVDDLYELKQEGNSGAHGIRVDFADEEVAGWASDATRIANILYDVLQGARIADSNSN